MSRRAVRLVLFIALSVYAAGPAPLRAQNARPGVVRGVVFDSLLTRAPLGGAEIWIETTNRMTRSDAEGQFTLSSLPPGHYELTFYHPILDSAGISLPAVGVDVVAGDSTMVALSTPGPAQAHHILCARDPLRQAGVLLGVVRDAADGKPLPGAIIAAHWTAYDLATGSVRSTQRSVEARTNTSGHVLLCGLPVDVALVISGRSEGDAIGMRVIDLAGRPFARADLDLAISTVTGSVKGVVRTKSGSLVPRATVLAVGTDASAQTDELGRFTLLGVTAGSGILEARAVGFMPGRAQTSVHPNEAQQIDIVVGDSVVVLDPVTVVGNYQPYLARVGFQQRRQTALGHFLDTTDIRQTGATRFEEVFRMVPGVQLRPNGSSYLLELQRGEGQIWNPTLGNYCAPLYFIDGVYYRLPPTQTPSVPVVPAEILGIEVYSNLFSAPPQYQRRDGACGVILVWTKRGIPKTKASQ